MEIYFLLLEPSWFWYNVYSGVLVITKQYISREPINPEIQYIDNEDY